MYLARKKERGVLNSPFFKTVQYKRLHEDSMDIITKQLYIFNPIQLRL